MGTKQYFDKLGRIYKDGDAITVHFDISDKTAPFLIKCGVLTTGEPNEHILYKKAVEWFKFLVETTKESNKNIDPNFLCLRLYKFMAIELDREYEDHILKCKSTYTVSPTCYSYIPASPLMYKCLPLFRSKEEAQMAINVFQQIEDLNII